MSTDQQQADRALRIARDAYNAAAIRHVESGGRIFPSPPPLKALEDEFFAAFRAYVSRYGYTASIIRDQEQPMT